MYSADGMPLMGLQSLSSDPPGCDVSKLDLLTGNLSEPLDHLPSRLSFGNASRYMAFYMPNEIMEPRFRSGEILIVDRQRPVGSGSDVLVEFLGNNAQPLFAVATLKERDRNQVTLIQYRYQVTETVHRSRIENLHAIVGNIDGLLR